jgi:rhamnosyltransferase subunit B
MARFILNTMFGGGELVLALRLGTLLRRHGHEIVLVTHAAHAEAARRCGFVFEPFDDEGGFESALADAIGVVDVDPRGSQAFFHKHVLSRALREYEAVARHRTTDCVIVGRSTSSIGARFASEKHGIPFVSSLPSPAFADGVRGTAELLAHLSDEMRGLRDSLGLGAVHDWADWLNSGSGGVGFWPSWFKDREASWPPNLQLVGFLLGKKTGNDLPPPLAEAFAHEAPILVTGGSAKYMTGEFFSTVIRGCEEIGKPFILIAPDRSVLPPNLPSSCMCVDFVEFADVLPRVAAVIHHGGIATCGEALAAGVPQLVLGAWLDRPYNAAQLQRLGVGEYLPPPRWNARGVADCLRHLMQDDSVGTRCREWAAKLRSEDPGTVVVEYLVDMARRGEPAGATRAAQREPISRADSSPKSLSERFQALSPAKRELLALSIRHPRTRGDGRMRQVSSEEIVPLSPNQLHMWHWHRAHPKDHTRNIIIAYRLTGRLNVPVLSRAVDDELRRHDVFRTRFEPLPDGPVQTVGPVPSGAMRVLDWSETPGEGRDGRIEDFATSEWLRCDDLAKADLTRVTLLRFADEDHVLFLSTHHIVMDAPSWQRFFTEVFTSYAAFLEGRPSPIEDPPTRYRDYAAWRWELLRSPELAHQIVAAKERFREAPPLRLPIDRPPAPVPTTRTTAARVRVAASALSALDALGAAESATRFVVLAAAFGTFLARVTGQKDVVFLALSSLDQAKAPELASVVGCFVDYILLRLEPPGADSPRGAIRQLNQIVRALAEHEVLPSAMVLDSRAVGDDPRARAMINVVDDWPVQPTPLEDLEVAQCARRFGPRVIDMVWSIFVPWRTSTLAPTVEAHLGISEAGGAWLPSTLALPSDTFDEASAVRLAEELASVLERFVAAPDEPML